MLKLGRLRGIWPFAKHTSRTYAGARCQNAQGTLLDLDKDELEAVKAVYGITSGILHGSPPEWIEGRRLWEARELARRAAVKALELLHHYLANGVKVSRQQFIALLDAISIYRREPAVLTLLERWLKR